MDKKNITIYDTTLRDGAQTVGISFSLQDKLRIAALLDRLKIDYIEGGWPGSNPKDELFFREIRKAGLEHSKIAAFGSTRRPGISCSRDEMIGKLIDARADIITIVAKTSDFQVSSALKIDLKENLQIISDTVSFLKDKGFTVFLDAEHFFDGYKSNPEYSLQTIVTAEASGADMIVLCDTNGGTLPGDARAVVSAVTNELTIPAGVHFHNDSGVAVANSMDAVLAGAVSVQGTMNGLGERCGNCDLSVFIPNAVLKMGLPCSPAGALVHLTEVSRFVSETANIAHNERSPYVGDNAFAHKGGIHVSALNRDTRTYEHVEPELVGNRRKVLVSELSGKSNIEFKARELGIDLGGKVDLPKEVLKKIKRLEDMGFQFESAEGSFELLIRKATGEYIPFFNLKGFRVITEKRENSEITCEASIQVEVNGTVEHTASNGDGPIEALDNALRKALEKFYPEIKDIHLTDYKVRVLDEKEGTGASVRVIIDQSDRHNRWGTVGVSRNIIEASWQALVDGIEFMLFKGKKNK